MNEEDAIKLRGYLRHKGKKRLISMWRQWYCVLNGHLLLFYRSESDYTKLGKFHDQIDLGLVYDVLPALGVENGIQISTHVGPHWLRCKDEQSCQQWLESLQASIVLRRQATLRRTKAEPVAEKSSKSVFSRQQKAKSTVPEYYLIQNKDPSDVEDKKASPFARLSLSFIPGHGKKYSTFDSHRSCRIVGDVIAEEKEEADREKVDDDDPPKSSPVKSRLKKESKEPRPLSESVSDFLLLNVSQPKAKETQVDDRLQVVRKKNQSQAHAPRLPTSFYVGKLLSHLEPKIVPKNNKSPSKSMNNLVQHSCPSESTLSRSSWQSDAAAVDKPRLPSTSKSDDVLSKRASNNGDIGQCQSVPPTKTEEAKEILDNQVPTDEKTANQNDDVTTPVIGAEQTIEKKKKQVGKVKETWRRKSGLAMLRQFFQSAKTGINKLKGDKQERLSVSPQCSRKNSREDNALEVKNQLAVQQTTVNIIVDDPLPEESTAETSDPKLETKISDGAHQSVEEEDFTAESAYVLEAKALEVCQPEALDVNNQLSTADEPVNSPVVVVPTVSIGKSNDSHLSTEQHQPSRNSIQSIKSLQEDDVAGLPSIPIKTKVKCPSPAYDVPRSNPIPIRNYLAVECNEKGNIWPDTSPQSTSSNMHFGEILTITTPADDEATDYSTVLDQLNQLGLPSNDQLTQIGSRLSYALSETEIVPEEAAETIDETMTS